MNQEANIAKRDKAGALAPNVFEADANAGSQNITQEDLALPFLKVLGQLSPEVNKKDSKYTTGAEPGKIYNTVTTELYDEIDVLPVFYKRQYVEWQDRGTSMGAPVAIHEVNSGVINEATRDKMNKDRLPNGNYLENTANHFVVLLSGSTPSTALISMKATQLKISKKWNTMMMSSKMQGKNGLFTPPLYSYIYRLKTVQQSNDKGTWYGWDVSKLDTIKDKGAYEIAKNFAERLSKGKVQIKHSPSETNTDVPY
jgi:hypothetical protein